MTALVLMITPGIEAASGQMFKVRMGLCIGIG